jgi:prolyl-tRNA editing enzyme YbaK/EbsC (Cys-tRNA(Pro) deacylase)
MTTPRLEIANQKSEIKKSRSVDRVREYFAQRGGEIEVKELAASTHTAQLAADAVGTALGSIVKSLVFIADDDRTVLTLVAGDQRANAAKIARHAGVQSVRMANGDEVRARTTYAIGGVPPVAHPVPVEGRRLETLVDQTLLRFERVWAAAGAPNALFEIKTRELLELTQGRVADIVVTEK